jgi:tetratricopeptide (TPR) repeat protein
MTTGWSRWWPAMLMALSVAGCRSERVVDDAASTPPVAAVGVTYASLRTSIDRDISAARRLAERPEAGWLAWERVAMLTRERAQLGGRFADYVAAEAAMTEAFERAPVGGGPWLSRAELSLSLHRHEAAEADLAHAERATLRSRDRAARIARVRAEIAVQRKKWNEAAAAVDEALAHKRDIASLLSSWRLANERNDQATARARLAETEGLAGKDERLRAWIALQRGLVHLARGKHEAALVEYAKADAHVRGWWLIEEHQAEAQAALGKHRVADALYARAVGETDKPELVMAWADVRAALGARDEADVMRQRARGELVALAVRYPRAMGDHARALLGGEP